MAEVSSRPLTCPKIIKYISHLEIPLRSCHYLTRGVCREESKSIHSKKCFFQTTNHSSLYQCNAQQETANDRLNQWNIRIKITFHCCNWYSGHWYTNNSAITDIFSHNQHKWTEEEWIAIKSTLNSPLLGDRTGNWLDHGWIPCSIVVLRGHGHRFLLSRSAIGDPKGIRNNGE